MVSFAAIVENDARAQLNSSKLFNLCIFMAPG
jgi:hypothetical protein